jgi:hypothetical protein
LDWLAFACADCRETCSGIRIIYLSIGCCAVHESCHGFLETIGYLSRIRIWWKVILVKVICSKFLLLISSRLTYCWHENGPFKSVWVEPRTQKCSVFSVWICICAASWCIFFNNFFININ